jgi:curved DNA-binding protein CbpA
MVVWNCYKVLGVDKKASLEIIQKAFRVGVLASHPDKWKNPDASKKFQEIHEARRILINPIERRRLDEALEADAEVPSAPSAPATSPSRQPPSASTTSSSRPPKPAPATSSPPRQSPSASQASPSPPSTPVTSSPGDFLNALLACSKVRLTLPKLRILSSKYGVPWPPDSSEFTEELSEKLKRNAHYMIDAKVVRGEWSSLAVNDVFHWINFCGVNLKYRDMMMMTKSKVLELAKSLNARRWYEKASHPSAARRKRKATTGKKRKKFDKSFKASSYGPAEPSKGVAARRQRSDDTDNGVDRRRCSASAKSSSYAQAAVQAKRKAKLYMKTKVPNARRC